MKVLILKPVLDLPFKRAPVVTQDLRDAFGQGDTAELRKHWADFVGHAAATFRDKGHNAVVLERPNWEFNPAVVNLYAPDIVLVPHRTAAQFGGLKCPALYYMQMYFRHLFTVDPQGWGASSSIYPCTDYGSGNANRDTFRDLLQLKDANQSKFAQPARRQREDLVRHGLIPDAPYIFVPCQIPHDETLRFHSDISMEAMIRAVTRWAMKKPVHVVIKEHPANRASMEPLRIAAQPGPFIHWSEASIHDLIENASAVFTVNSGVGFEAILNDKPVVCFGRAEYDAVTVNADLDTIGEAWQAIAPDGKTPMISPRRKTFYRKFVDWYVRINGFDLLSAELPRRMATLVADAEAMVEKAAASDA